MSPSALRIATRGSPLALTQAESVAARLGADAEIVVIKTEGDRRTDVPLEALAGRGVFTSEVQAAVLDGRADIAVHSAKDLPSSRELQVDGLVLACVPERADVRDCLIGSTVAALPRGATVGTGSTRRQALLAHVRPDLTFVGLRGKGRSEKHGNGEKARDDGHENSLPGTDSSSCRPRGSIANHECVTVMRATGRQAVSG